MITKTGELIDYIMAAAEQGCRPTTDVRVRIGSLGPEYTIKQVKGLGDQRGVRLILELNPVPDAL